MKAILKNWPAMALALSLVMLAIAHAFQTFGHMAPCELCLKQREVYWAAVIAAGMGMALSFTPLDPGRLVSAVLALIFAGGMAVAAYHAGVEWKFWPGPASCTGGSLSVNAADLSKLLHGGPIPAPQCDKPAWIFLGISMAGWNALVSLGLMLVSIIVAGVRGPDEEAAA